MLLLTQGRFLELVECLEKGLVLRHMLFGAKSRQVLSACTELGALCNKVAMQAFHEGTARVWSLSTSLLIGILCADDLVLCLELLRKAEILTEHEPAEKAVTFNNLGVLFRRQNKLHTALQYMRKAAEIESSLQKVKQPGDVHLNLCVTLSQCGKHKEALKAIKRSIQLLQQELFEGIIPGLKQTHKHRADRIATMAVAYHNMGVEYEFLFKMTDALKAYGSGVELASTYLGEAHGVTQTLRKSQNAARKSIQKHARMKEKAEEKAQRLAEEKMLLEIRAAAAAQRAADDVANKEKQLAARNIRARDSLDHLVEANTATIKDTAFGRGRRSRAPSELKLEEKLKKMQATGMVRSGAQKNSSAALLSHVQGGRPSKGATIKPKSAVDGGVLFSSMGHSAESKSASGK